MNITKNGACNWANRVKRAEPQLATNVGALVAMQVVTRDNGHGNDHNLHMLYTNGFAKFDGVRRTETLMSPMQAAFAYGMAAADSASTIGKSWVFPSNVL